MIDPGHGGSRSGAVGPGGVEEKAIALSIARLTKTKLQKTLSAEVLLTRDNDVMVPLSDRVAFANRQRADVFVSIHANSMPTHRQRVRTEGLETFFLSASASDEEASRTAKQENSEWNRSGRGKNGNTLALILADLVRSEAQADSSRLAYVVHQALIASTGAKDSGVRQAPFYVLAGVAAPAILVEVGFVSHEAESRRLQDIHYQQQIADALAQGIGSFLSQYLANGMRQPGPSAPNLATKETVEEGRHSIGR